MKVLDSKILQIKVQLNSAYCGKFLKGIELPLKCHILGIIRGTQLILAS